MHLSILMLQIENVYKCVKGWSELEDSCVSHARCWAEGKYCALSDSTQTQTPTAPPTSTYE